MKKIRILLIDDHRMLREGIAASLNAQKDLKVVAKSGGPDALTLARTAKPDIVLMDLGLTDLDGLQVITSLIGEFPKIRVIGLGLIPSQQDIVELVQAGASGFVLKDARLADVVETIRTVAAGGKVLPPLLTGSLFSHIVENALRKGIRTSGAVRMTNREREIIALIGDGMSNKEIATRLDISTYTVKSHVHNIMEKLALHSRLQIAMHTIDSN